MAALTIDAVKQAINDAIKPLVEKVDKVVEKVDKIIPILGALEVKERNSSAGRDEPLEWPPNRETGTPYDPQEPININCLLVAGNEMLPNGQPNSWNRTKSKAALSYYGEGGDSDSEGSEYSATSRARRLRVARVLGISRAQLNFAQLTL